MPCLKDASAFSEISMTDDRTPFKPAKADEAAELRQLLATSIEHADRGELAPLDMDELRRKAEAIRARTTGSRSNGTEP